MHYIFPSTCDIMWRNVKCVIIYQDLIKINDQRQFKKFKQLFEPIEGYFCDMLDPVPDKVRDDNFIQTWSDSQSIKINLDVFLFCFITQCYEKSFNFDCRKVNEN